MEAVGEEIYGVLVQIHPELAGKLTGMLLQLGEDECWACLESQERLAERLDEAFAILDQSGGAATKRPTPKAAPSRAAGDEEKRIDSEDGKARTYSELCELCAGKYTDAEIVEYWESLRPADQSRATASKAAAKPRAGGYPAAEAEMPAPKPAPAPVAAQPDAVEEALPGLIAWLTELKLSKYLATASAWVEEQGAMNLEEIIENLGDFAEGLQLKTLERQRLERGAEAALEVAKAAPPVPAAAPVPEPAPEPARAATKSAASKPSGKSAAKSKAGAKSKAAAQEPARPSAEELRIQREADRLEAEKRREAEELAAESARLAEEAEWVRKAVLDEMAELEADAEEEQRYEEARAEAERQKQRKAAAASQSGPAVHTGPARRVAPKARTKSQEEVEWDRENERQEKEFKRQQQIRQAKMEAEAAEKAKEEKKLAKAREAEERERRIAAELEAKMSSANKDAGDAAAAEEFPSLGGDDWKVTSGKKGKKKR